IAADKGAPADRREGGTQSVRRGEQDQLPVFLLRQRGFYAVLHDLWQDPPPLIHEGERCRIPVDGKPRPDQPTVPGGRGDFLMPVLFPGEPPVIPRPYPRRTLNLPANR